MLGITIWIVIAYQIFFKKGRLSSNFTFTNFWIGLILISTFCLICFQFVNGPRLFLLITIFNVAVFDSGAYIIGKNFGKNSFLPELSPNKTIEGLIGGLICTIIFMIILNYLFINFYIFNFLLIIFTIIFLSFLGDIIESYYKRLSNIKNSSMLIPGHGGFFDRFDSFILVSYGIFFYKFLIN